jgi:type I restriction enzyme S subunit
MNKQKKGLVPELRFPEFRDAEGWEQRPIGEKVDLLSGYPFKSEEISEDANGIPLMRGINITEGHIRHSQDIDRFFLGDAEKLKKYLLKCNDLVIGMDGSKVGKNSALVTDKDSGSLLIQRVARLRTDCKATISFIFQHIHSIKFHSYVDRINTSGGIPHISAKQINEFEICFPPLEKEQQKIADCLSSLDELITLEAQKLETLKTHKKGLMQQLFPAEGETVPKLRFPEFRDKGEWEESPLSKFILSLDAGVSVNSGDRPANETEFGVLKTSAVTNGVFEPEENKVVFAENEQSRLKEPVCGGTIIISRMNTPALVGANAYVESSHENLFLPDRLWAAKPREGVSIRFLALILGSDKGRAALSKLAKGSSGSMKNITKPEVLAFSVMAPSVPEQQKIADCLSSLDELITTQTQKLETLKTHKKGLMQKLFPSLREGEES